MEIKKNHISIQDVEEVLKQELPGKKAHSRMLPEGRSLEMPTEKFAKVKESAVLVFLILKDHQLHFCLTRRNRNMKHHPGQISFPGGRREENESTMAETALRELEEETGSDKTKVKIIGRLSELYVSVSNFIIHPIVGYIDHEPEFKIDPEEVEELILLPVESFFDKKNIVSIEIDTTSGKLNVPCFRIKETIIWGATAMIVAEFTALLSELVHPKVKYSDNGDISPE